MNSSPFLIHLRKQHAKLIYAILLSSVLLLSSSVYAQTVEYDLVIEKQPVNFTGKEVTAMTINRGIPGPTLFMTEGDDLKVRVHNKMDVETSIHWHGLLLPNKEDGVPYLTTAPIKPGTTHEFSFPIIQSGTYWYHSHTGLQEQRGVYGSIVIHPKQKRHHADREYVLVFSDWTDEDPHEVLRTLKRGSDYYSIRKGSVQSLWGAVRANALKDMFQRSLIRHPPMDISDIAYDRFLVNGRPKTELTAAPGETIRLRIVNASASTYFYLNFAGSDMRVVSADGIDVEPAQMDRLLMAVAETYDLLVTIPPDAGSYEFRATAQDGSDHVSVYFGEGNPHPAPNMPKPNTYKMHGGGAQGHGKHKMERKIPMDEGHTMSMGSMSDMAMERPLAPYDKLRAVHSTELPPDRPMRTVTLTLTGDMERYVWSFDNKILSEADKILIRRGENMRMVFVNRTMMHHPIHLHGHFFRVLNGQGDRAPLKHTVDVPPLGSQTIEFYGNEDKDWFIHCHILYHMKVGMARILHYEGSIVDPVLAEARKTPSNFLNKDPWFFWGQASFLSQMTEGALVAANTRNILGLQWDGGWEEDEYDVDVTYDRYVNRFLSAFAGFNVTKEETDAIVGVRYLLPLNYESEVRLDTEGDLRFTLAKEMMLTSRLSAFAEAEYDGETRWEWAAGGEWTLNKQLSLIGQYHSEYGGGGGITIRF